MSTIYRRRVDKPREIDLKLRECAYCGQFFVVRNAKALYCSDSCRASAHKTADRAARKIAKK
jgi:ribosomal protein L37AE/L43A